MQGAQGTILISTTDVATTTFTVSGLAFAPTVIVFEWNGRTDATDAIGRGTARRGFGVATGTSARWCMAALSSDAAAAAVTAAAQSDQCCILTVNGLGSAIDGKVDCDAMLSDGFRLIVDDAVSGNLRVGWTALDAASAAVFTLTEPGATGDVTVTGLSFQPMFALFGNIPAATAAEGVAIDSRMMLGAASGSGTAQAVLLAGSNDAAATMQTLSYCLDGECIAALEATVTSIAARASFSAFTADGLTVTYAERSGARLVHGLALADPTGQFVVAGGTTQTDTTTSIAMPGAAGVTTLVGGLVFSHGKAESVSDTPQDHDAWSSGAFTSASSRMAFAALDEDAVADSEVTTASEFDAVYVNISTASAIEGLMDVDSMSGKTYIMDDADPSAMFFWNILFGTAAAPGGGGATIFRQQIDAAMRAGSRPMEAV